MSDDDYIFAESEERQECIACQHAMADTRPCEACGDRYCETHMTETEDGWFCGPCEQEAYAAHDAELDHRQKWDER